MDAPVSSEDAAFSSEIADRDAIASATTFLASTQVVASLSMLLTLTTVDEISSIIAFTL